jgi:hypothetical protein
MPKLAIDAAKKLETIIIPLILSDMLFKTWKRVR